jgi:SAM-dependent methyltransferase
MSDFDDLLAEGLGLDVEAYWGAGFLEGRYRVKAPPWTWRELARPHLACADSALDMGTGEGGRLVDLAPLPRFTVAYEEWWPTVPAAAARLLPTGVNLVVCRGSVDNTELAGPPDPLRPGLPFADHSFDVVLNRHECFDPAEVLRILRPSGVFLTQQVGSLDTDSLRDMLGLDPAGGRWDRSLARRQVESAGLEVADSGEDFSPFEFTDIAALIGYVRTIPWAVPEFDATSMRGLLRRLQQRCETQGGVVGVSHRFWLAAREP